MSTAFNYICYGAAKTLWHLSHICTYLVSGTRTGGPTTWEHDNTNNLQQEGDLDWRGRVCKLNRWQSAPCNLLQRLVRSSPYSLTKARQPQEQVHRVISLSAVGDWAVLRQDAVTECNEAWTALIRLLLQTLHINAHKQPHSVHRHPPHNSRKHAFEYRLLFF